MADGHIPHLLISIQTVSSIPFFLFFSSENALGENSPLLFPLLLLPWGNSCKERERVSNKKESGIAVYIHIYTALTTSTKCTSGSLGITRISSCFYVHGDEVALMGMTMCTSGSLGITLIISCFYAPRGVKTRVILIDPLVLAFLHTH